MAADYVILNEKIPGVSSFEARRAVKFYFLGLNSENNLVSRLYEKKIYEIFILDVEKRASFEVL